MNPLEKILKYNLNDEEAKAYRLALTWVKLVRKYLNGENNPHPFPKGDPRKAFLFKLCWKLLRETKGLIKQDDYKFYLYAQIDMLKRISNSSMHANIDNNVIVGAKAWRRWKMWQVNFNKKLMSVAEVSEDNTIEELARVRRFFVKNYNIPTQADFSLANIRKWLDNGDVTPTYILLSPYSKKCVGESFGHLGFDPKLFEKRLTGKVQDFFQKEFSYEFGEIQT